MYSTMIDPVYALHLRVGEKSLDPYPLDRLKPALTQFSEELLLEVPQIFRERIDIVSYSQPWQLALHSCVCGSWICRQRQMKVPSFPGSKVLGESGENLPSSASGYLRRSTAKEGIGGLAAGAHSHGCKGFWISA